MDFQTFWLLTDLLTRAISRGAFAPKNLKSPIFILQRAYIPKNGVEFRQQTNSDNKTGVATSQTSLTRCDRSDSVFFRLSHPERGGLENTLSDLSHPVREGLTVYFPDLHTWRGRVCKQVRLPSSIQGLLLPKIANFHPTEGVHTKKWGRISSAD